MIAAFTTMRMIFLWEYAQITTCFGSGACDDLPKPTSFSSTISSSSTTSETFEDTMVTPQQRRSKALSSSRHRGSSRFLPNQNQLVESVSPYDEVSPSFKKKTSKKRYSPKRKSSSNNSNSSNSSSTREEQTFAPYDEERQPSHGRKSFKKKSTFSDSSRRRKNEHEHDDERQPTETPKNKVNTKAKSPKRTIAKSYGDTRDVQPQAPHIPREIVVSNKDVPQMGEIPIIVSIPYAGSEDASEISLDYLFPSFPDDVWEDRTLTPHPSFDNDEKEDVSEKDFHYLYQAALEVEQDWPSDEDGPMGGFLGTCNGFEFWSNGSVHERNSNNHLEQHNGVCKEQVAMKRGKKRDPKSKY
jgi:hypothetical protein